MTPISRIAIFTAFVFAFIGMLTHPHLVESAERTPVRLGWQIPWATQGQLVQALKHSNIPAVTNITLNYVGFTYGGPLNRAALSGEVDILLTGDQPAVVLLSKGRGYRIVARMMYNRVCLYVPPKSTVTDLTQLKNKSLMGPIGAAAERVALDSLEQAGVSADEIKFGPLDMEQQNALLRASTPGEPTWQGVDGMFGFDPLPTIWKSAGLARILSCGKVVSVVVASEEMVTTRRDELKAFLGAFLLAWDQYRQHPEKYGRFFLDEAKLDAGLDALDEAASIEPNRWASAFDQIDLKLSSEDLVDLENARRFLASRKMIGGDFELKPWIDTQLVTDVLADRDLERLAASVQ